MKKKPGTKTTSVALVSVKDASVVRVKTEANKVSTTASEMVVKTADDVAQATEVLINIAKSEDAIGVETNKVLAPLKTAMDAEKARWKPILDLLAASKKELSARVLAAKKELAVVAAAKEAKILADLASGKIKKETTAVAKLGAVTHLGATVHGAYGGSTGTRKVKKLVITDPLKIPRAYLVVDEVALRKALMAGNKIEGAELQEEETLAIRKK